MLDLEEINKTIQELENGETNFGTCQKLSYLYIVREHFAKDDAVITEYNDILPSYSKYCEIKRKFQLNELPDTAIQPAILAVCKEVKEFLLILYNNTDTQNERELLQEMLNSTVNEITKRA